MSHPFLKMFDKALEESTDLDNCVLKEAERLLAKGYQAKEIYDVLVKLEKSLIDVEEAKVVEEAMEEFAENL